MKIKEVIEQSSAINLYYMNSLEIVTLRPVLVTLGGGAKGDSSLFAPLAPPVHLSFEVPVSLRLYLGFSRIVAQIF